MMDLALEMGCTVQELGDRMMESELRMWGRYVEQKGLPMMRLEHLLARILMILDLVHMRKPGTEGRVTDYLPGAKLVTDAERAGRALAEAFGGNGIVIKRKKKRG